MKISKQKYHTCAHLRQFKFYSWHYVLWESTHSLGPNYKLGLCLNERDGSTFESDKENTTIALMLHIFAKFKGGSYTHALSTLMISKKKSWKSFSKVPPGVKETWRKVWETGQRVSWDCLSCMVIFIRS